ncbi:protein NLP6-like [Amaranthus tricolor]|uniref:protein NLP6-like n=1 Tax=Amaranthus tricolor TaxID=29722 RepID=UPI002584A7FA|nr:protein NLP6-like [Amaranthus tricolor]
MSEAATTEIEEENHQKSSSLFANYSNNFPRTREFQSGVTQAQLHHTILGPSSSTFMDLDFGDLDASWSFDQIPTSPVLISTSDQPFSPLWAFADDRNPTGIRIPAELSRFTSCNPEPASENGGDEGGDDDNDDDKKKIPCQVLGFTPIDNFDVSFIIKERMTQALRYFKESTEQNQILAQIWAPVKSGNNYVLTTSGQPFVLGPHSNGLNQYRTVSLMYMFSVDGESVTTLGLPGRVFRQKLPEWTPNVQYYSSKEYPRVNHAKHYNVRGTLALPVLEPSGQSCVGVLELIMTSQKINYAPEVDKVCKALEAVNLKSSKILDHPNIQICNEGRQNALAEILEVLTEVCETYKLPLAQTWVPCRHRSVLAYGGGLKKSCSSFDGSCMGQVCMSTTDVAFYVVDARMWGFREACAEHHLQKGQGVAGRSFSSHGLSFCRDISQFCKIEYPLVHYARLFELTGSFAICLRSKHTGDDDYVLEFFLPRNLTDSSEQLSFLDSILSTMKHDLQNLMVASGRALEEERKHMEIIEVSSDENLDLQVESNLSTRPLPVVETINGVLPFVKNSPPQLVEPDARLAGKSVGGAGGIRNGISLTDNKEPKKASERKRGKAEKQISLEVLQQYFAGSLKDAAKSLGVCPTTMKRICRQHGISRWPSRKINKVNRSLTKLKRVIESVQGTDGTFSLTTLAQPTIPVPVGSITWPAGANGTCQQQSPTYVPVDLPDERSEMPQLRQRVDGQTSGRVSSHEERIHEPNGFASKASGSREVSAGTSTSHGSCHGSPGTESTPQNGHFVPNFHEQAGHSTGLICAQNGELRLSAGYSIPDTLLAAHHPQEAFGGMLLEDVGSSKDLRNLCPSTAEANIDETIPEHGWINQPCSNPSPRVAMSAAGMMPRFSARQDMKTITIKATFREDIIRFRFSLSSNIVELKDEVAKRFKLEVGTFEIKYLDDDHEWVLIACDSDLQECLDISKSSGSNMIRLLIQDILGNLGSSCESSGE